MTVPGLHPAIQAAALHVAHPDWSLAELGAHFGITKQAAQKRLARAMPYLTAFDAEPAASAPPPAVEARIDVAEREVVRLGAVADDLRRRLVLYAVGFFMLTLFRERVLEFFPRFKLARLKPHEKKRVLDLWAKFERLGGSLRDYAKSVGKSPDTIRAWLDAFAKYGMAGLVDKTTRPKHFGHKLPLWVRDQLLILFLRHPQWTPYQYHKYLRMNPATNFAVSLPTIEKLKQHHAETTAAEKARQKKLWAFAVGTDVWTIDFTCILKDDRFKLQLLTVSDHRSRFYFDAALFLDTSTERVLDHLQDLFIKYGRPMMIKADNGPEFRMDCRAGLDQLGVYLLSSPVWYGQFCGAHERIHRELKTNIDDFDAHRDLGRLVADVARHRDDHNHRWPLEVLDMKTPAQVFYSEPDFVPRDVEVVTPYAKDGELRMKFTNRAGKPARIAMALLADEAPPPPSDRDR